MEGETAPVPNVRAKLDELFLHWLSKATTQDLLHQELKRVLSREENPRTVATLSNGTLSAPSEARSPSPPSELHCNASPSPPPVSQAPRSHSKNNKKSQLSLKSTKQALTDANEQTLQEANVDRPSNTITIPPFYFPFGRPDAPESREVDGVLKEAHRKFKTCSREGVSKEEFGTVVKACGLPLYWKAPLFHACSGGSQLVTYSMFKKMWTRMVQYCHDEAARFVYILAGHHSGRTHLVEDDFLCLVQDVVECHPGLAFLSATPEFHTRYIETVISRIFYTVGHSWHCRITLPELRKSKLLQVISSLEIESDINQELLFFSYEHFYVLYCKFWELDTDHDLVIDAKDLSRHQDHALSAKIIDRLLSGVVTSKESAQHGTMSYKEFIWFLLSEEDKATNRSIEYWFRCLDVDGDGCLSLYEMEQFYSATLDKMQSLGIEGLPVEDCLCQILDMVNPATPNVIALRDLKACKLAPVFFDTFVNVEKYLQFEQREPTASVHLEEGAELSDWDKYAAEQYELLIAEEEQEDSDSDLGPEDKEALLAL